MRSKRPLCRPDLSVKNTISFTDKFIGTESLYDKGLVLPIHLNLLHGAICNRVLVPAMAVHFESKMKKLYNGFPVSISYAWRYLSMVF